ncbi:hypothetical protein ILYODFUR_031380, partial [Ilyodon furcidens]
GNITLAVRFANPVTEQKTVVRGQKQGQNKEDTNRRQGPREWLESWVGHRSEVMNGGGRYRHMDPKDRQTGLVRRQKQGCLSRKQKPMKYPTWAKQSREIHESKRDQIRQPDKEGPLDTTHTKAFKNLALVVREL